MKKQLKIELKKAIFSPYFLFGFGLLTLFAVLSAIYILGKNGSYTDSIKADAAYAYNPDLPLFSFFSSWIGSERMSLAYTLFFNLMPIGAALPFAWSFCSERKSGYIKNIVIRDNKKNYYTAKTMAIFVSGMLVVLIPLLINIFIVSSKMPLYKPFAGYNFYNCVYFGDLFADFYYSYPGLYVSFYIALNTIYGGLFALLGAAFSFYISNIFSAVLFPFVTMLILAYIEHALQGYLFAGNIVELIPTQFLHASTLYANSSGIVVAAVAIAMSAFSFFTIYFKGVKNEIY
ncbi:MAG: hypothetical protein PUD24_06175 [Oscillospiraceae bacterium]|nr:hypothetical protein [Oscillospiraceae bacterium]